MNDFILVHTLDSHLDNIPALIRISEIKSVEMDDETRIIYMKDGSYYIIVETVEEIFKMIKDNGN